MEISLAKQSESPDINAILRLQSAMMLPMAAGFQQAQLPNQSEIFKSPTLEQDKEALPASESYHIINSPIVGTFYAAPSPESDPYIEIGSHVSKGQTLCIVEAMKLMNEIESDIPGTVIKILVQNAQPVEYGQPLFYIKPD